MQIHLKKFLSIVLVIAVGFVFSIPCHAYKTDDSINADTVVTLPLSEYKAGSVFSSTYAGASQCMAFALYAFDKYSHITSPSGSWGILNSHKHTYSAYQSKITTSQLQNVLKSLPIGSYVRVAKGTSNQNTNGHSFIIVSTTNAGVMAYDANRIGTNIVGYQLWKYSEIVDSFPYLYLTAYHNYGKSTKYNSMYHKSECTTNGCEGYAYMPHYTTNPGEKAVCAACGYVGSISAGTVSIGDELTFDDDEYDTNEEITITSSILFEDDCISVDENDLISEDGYFNNITVESPISPVFETEPFFNENEIITSENKEVICDE